MLSLPLLITLIFIAALLYSSVGHAGASGYLAAMALLGMEPLVMKPTALVLNILVGAIAAYQFSKAGHFSWKRFWPFALLSIPCAFWGGTISLPSTIYKPILGLVLLFAAWRLFFVPRISQETTSEAFSEPPLPLALGIGALIGFLSGITGVGGGIFLTPLLLLMKWSDTKTASGVSAAFILVNSIAGLLGHVKSVSLVPDFIPYLALAAGLGGWIGASYGSTRLRTVSLRKVLSLVLSIAGLKMLTFT